MSRRASHLRANIQPLNVVAHRGKLRILTKAQSLCFIKRFPVTITIGQCLIARAPEWPSEPPPTCQGVLPSGGVANHPRLGRDSFTQGAKSPSGIDCVGRSRGRSRKQCSIDEKVGCKLSVVIHEVPTRAVSGQCNMRRATNDDITQQKAKLLLPLERSQAVATTVKTLFMGVLMRDSTACRARLVAAAPEQLEAIWACPPSFSCMLCAQLAYPCKLRRRVGSPQSSGMRRTRFVPDDRMRAGGEHDAGAWIHACLKSRPKPCLVTQVDAGVQWVLEAVAVRCGPSEPSRCGAVRLQQPVRYSRVKALVVRNIQ